MAVILGFIVSVAGFGVRHLFSNKRKAQIEEVWTQVAADLGLKYAGATSAKGFGNIFGTIRDVRVYVDVKLRGTGDGRTEYTSFRVDFERNSNASFNLSKQTQLTSWVTQLGRQRSEDDDSAFAMFTRFASLLGPQDREIGDPEFDSQVLIDAANLVALDRYLTPARRTAIMVLMENNEFVEITPGSLTTELQGVRKDPETMKARITYLVEVALVLASPSEIDRALEKQKRGDLADAVLALHELNAVQDAGSNSFTEFLEAEALVAMGEGEQASNILDDLPVFDPVLGEWKAVAKKHPKPVELKPVSSANVEAPKVSLDQKSVITDLFESDRPSHQIEERFFDAYEGSTVEWFGKVGEVRNIRMDGDFPGVGVKATVNIGSYGKGELLGGQVHAIVHLPEGTKLVPGDGISFRGTFIRTDRYMSNLFVADAELV